MLVSEFDVWTEIIVVFQTPLSHSRALSAIDMHDDDVKDKSLCALADRLPRSGVLVPS